MHASLTELDRDEDVESRELTNPTTIATIKRAFRDISRGRTVTMSAVKSEALKVAKRAAKTAASGAHVKKRVRA
jgi:hypothetical protein